VNWEAIYLNATVGGALIVAIACVLVLAYYAHKALRREKHPTEPFVSIHDLLDRDARAVSGEEPYEVLYRLERMPDGTYRDMPVYPCVKDIGGGQ
jgi:hypothetical protein